MTTANAGPSARLTSARNEHVRMTVVGRITFMHAGWVVLGASVLLMLIGVYGISLATGLRGGGLSSLAIRQIVFGGAGIVAAIVVALPHYRWYAFYVWPLATLTIGLLIFVLIPFVPDALVTPRNGARRWINFGVADFQPSELAKVVFVLATAAYLRFRKKYRTLRGLVPPAIITCVPMALILVEPDLGTALLFVPTLLVMLIAAGAKLWHLIAVCGLGLGFALTVIVASLGFAERGEYPLLRPHQVERIQAVVDQFTGETRFLQERGFQGKQATTLAGAGGFSGHPEQRSRALIQFSRLPERHNDMIFAVILGRFGFIGAVAVIGLYFVWAAGALAVASACKDPFGRLVVVGLAAIVITQASINIGMTIGLLPITGMTLPFVSYGGSSLLMAFVMVGLVWNVAMRRPELLWRESFEFDDEE